LHSFSLLLPVELRRVNHGASTNGTIVGPRICALGQPWGRATYNASAMQPANTTDQIAERVERLLLRYEELQRTNALLTRQVDTLSQERDSLKSRLGAARARIDALLDRLPQTSTAHAEATAVNSTSSHADEL